MFQKVRAAPPRGWPLVTLVAAIRREPKGIAGVSAKEFADFVITLFCTGARIGEALAMTYNATDLGNHFIRISRQVKQNGVRTTTKTKKERRSVVIDFGAESVANWAQLDKKKFNRFQAAKYLSSKTAELFKDDVKHISLHGLRHSYAIHLLNKEVSISSVALFLGDSISTAEHFYINFIATTEQIDNAVLKLAR